ncbi:MAG: alkylmercury lyase [Actinobacteria bacterium]|nr:MAG: alkylmercury lyase [Actinomycetota bacterium]
MTDTHDIQQLAVDLAAAMPKFDRTEQELSLALLRELAHGAPVGIGRLTVATSQRPEQTTAMLERLPGVFRDEQQRVVGFMGLTVVEMGEHRIHLHGRALSAWCAWDTLFLPDLLGETAGVTSRCPITGEQISLTVLPTGPADLQPADVVVSFLLPEAEFDASVIQRFCHFVHFFASSEAAAEWTAEHPRTFTLSVKEAYELGQLTNRAVWSSATAARC